MDHRSRSPARLLAPIALVVFAFALFAVIATSGGDGGSDEGSSSSGNQQAQSETTTETTSSTGASGRASYTVKTGDTLAGIAEANGTTVDDLIDLNPGLDPQTLVSGQKIRLRE